MSRRAIPYVFIAVIVGTTLTAFPTWTVDDAYITFRYADNLARHGQLTYNIGEEPVDGYTSPLLTVALATAIRCGADPRHATHAIGIGALLAALWLFERLVKRLCSPGAPRPVLLLLMATAPFFYTHAFGGLETLLFTGLILGSALQLHRVLENPSVRCLPHALLALLLLLLSLCRPEGAVLAAISVLVTVAVLARGAKGLQLIAPAAGYTAALIVPGAGYFVWRWLYYGFPLPNTFYVKVNGVASASTASSLKDFAIQYCGLPAIAVALTWLARHTGRVGGCLGV